ncbi:equilibrative nucleobase transporter 1-like [Mobula hypostoma]|uniref:equilibrative nucleobase transporter 1-like n=1 Tax=Mobula hypostoma TaxID=723540 RepID=UPI002FC3A654
MVKRIASGRAKQYLTFGSGLLECIGFAGTVFGWASLVFVLKREGYFADLCVPANHTTVGGGVGSNSTDLPPIPENCDLQDERFALIFTLASFMNNFVSLANGLLFDRCGTSVTRAVGISLYTLSTLMIALSTAVTAYLLFPALSFMAVGGIIFLLTNMQIGNLFGEKRSTVITLYNGAFDSSSAVFLLVKVLYETGLSLRAIFLFISSLSVIHVLRTIFLLPRTSIPYPLPEGYTYGARCGRPRRGSAGEAEEAACQREPLRGGDGTQRTTEAQEDGVERPENGDSADRATPGTAGGAGAAGAGDEEVPSFRSCVLSSLFVTHCVWLSVMQLRHYLFIGTLNPMLTLLAHGHSDLVSQFTNAFAFTQFCGVFFAPWNGLIMDRNKRASQPENEPSASPTARRLAETRATVLSLAITVSQCVCFSLCAAIPVLKVQYLTFVLQVVNRSFLYGGHAAFIATAFPPCHFGKVYGLVMALSAVVSLLQYPCFALVKGPLNDDPLYMNIGFVILSALAFIHPINVYLHCKRRAQPRAPMDAPAVNVPAEEGKGVSPTRESDISPVTAGRGSLGFGGRV